MTSHGGSICQNDKETAEAEERKVDLQHYERGGVKNLTAARFHKEMKDAQWEKGYENYKQGCV